MLPTADIDQMASPTPGEYPLEFCNGEDRQIFRFTYAGEERSLQPYLLERYGPARDARWREEFYPHRVRCNDGVVDGATLVRPGDRLSYLHLRHEEPPAAPLGPPLYEDERLLAVLKNDRAPVNPSGVYYFTSLAIQVRETLGDPQLTPLHRLDLETAGPVLFAKRPADLKTLHKLFHRKALNKRYRALVHGAFPDSQREIRGQIVPDHTSRIHTKLRLEPELPAGSALLATSTAPQSANPPPKSNAEVSHTRILGVTRLAGGRFSELLLEPVTGKTNQLRVHLAHAGHPIVGDKKYYPDEAVFLDWYLHRDFERLRDRLLLPRQALYCESLSFAHPFSGEWIEIKAPAEVWAGKIAGLPGV